MRGAKRDLLGKPSRTNTSTQENERRKARPTRKTEIPLSYRVSTMYYINDIDHVFNLSITSIPVNPMESALLTIDFKPVIPNQSYKEYFIIDDSSGKSVRLTVTGKCFGTDKYAVVILYCTHSNNDCSYFLNIINNVYLCMMIEKTMARVVCFAVSSPDRPVTFGNGGPKIVLDKKKLTFEVVKKVSEHRMEVIKLQNKSSVDTTYQWLLPLGGQGYFQISTGNCGVIRALETIRTSVLFTGCALGIYSAEIVCLILHQEPIFLNVVATVSHPGYSMYDIDNHTFTKSYKKKCHTTHFMENSLNLLKYFPSSSVTPTYLDFGRGSTTDNTLNISQTISVTNHEDNEGYIQWMPDPDNIFIVDPIASVIPAKESTQFTVRFRPKTKDYLFGYLMFGDYQKKVFKEGQMSLKHSWFRIPCVGTTWSPCTEWTTQWNCPTEIIMPPTAPVRTTFINFSVNNKLDIPMHFKFEAPDGTNFVVMPMCGIIQSRGWAIVTIAMEPRSAGEYYENWDLYLNTVQRVRMRFCGNAELSKIEMMANGYSHENDAMNEFPPTITETISYSTTYIHNLTRMDTHIRVLTYVPWLGGDNCGTMLLGPKEVINFQWWFYPKEADKVYITVVTLSCICLINGKPVGSPTEFTVYLTGFSEYPDLRALPKKTNLHDIIVGETASVDVLIYNFSSCFFTWKLHSQVCGMGDDHSRDTLDMISPVNSLKPSTHVTVKMVVTPKAAGSRQINITYTVLYPDENNEIVEIEIIKKKICTIWYDGIYPTIKIMRTISTKSPVILSNHCTWNICNVEAFNKVLMDCRPNIPLKVDLYAQNLSIHAGPVEMIFVMGCVYRVPVAWNLRREKICDCKMVQISNAVSNYERKYECTHREMVELFPLNGIVSPDNPGLLTFKFQYTENGPNTLCYVLTIPHNRTIFLYINLYAHDFSKGVLTPLRRLIDQDEYLTVLDCGKVPINNLDPVIRIVWLYNPTDVFATWRLLRGNIISNDAVIRCLLYFAEVPSIGKLAIPFAFMPTEMIDYEVVFLCSFGYDTVKILVKGQGGLPNCLESRLDMPGFIPQIYRAVYRTNIVYLSKEHFTLPEMSTHSLSRDIVAICNDTDDIMRFIWLPERIANIVNVVMTPCWGVIQPRSSEWITMTVYSLQEPATFTTTIACEILNLTERRAYQRNELLRRSKIEQINQEFTITENGTFQTDINRCPPFVLHLKKPHPFYLAMTVALSSKGQRDGYPRLLLKQMWEQTPPYDLLCSEINEQGKFGERGTTKNNVPIGDIIRIIDGILWDSMHCKMFKNQIKFYAKEEIPTYHQLNKVFRSDVKARLSRRVTSGICDAIVNKALFHVYSLNPKHDAVNIIDI